MRGMDGTNTDYHTSDNRCNIFGARLQKRDVKKENNNGTHQDDVHKGRAQKVVLVRTLLTGRMRIPRR